MYAIRSYYVLADVLKEQNAVVDVRQVSRSHQMRDQREVAAPEHALAGEIGALERALDIVALAAEQPPALLERVRRRRGRTEVVAGHRAGELV